MKKKPRPLPEDLCQLCVPAMGLMASLVTAISLSNKGIEVGTPAHIRLADEYDSETKAVGEAATAGADLRDYDTTRALLIALMEHWLEKLR